MFDYVSRIIPAVLSSFDWRHEFVLAIFKVEFLFFPIRSIGPKDADSGGIQLSLGKAARTSRTLWLICLWKRGNS